MIELSFDGDVCTVFVSASDAWLPEHAHADRRPWGAVSQGQFRWANMIKECGYEASQRRKDAEVLHIFAPLRLCVK